MAALGLLAGYFMLVLRRKQYNFTQNDVSDSIFWLAVSGFVGARLLYVIRFWNEIFIYDYMEILRVYNGGLVFLGGFALALFTGVVLCRIRKWSLSSFADFLAPALPMGHAFGRLGCLLNGCCFGFNYEGPCSFRYENYVHSTFPIQGVGFLVNVALAGFLFFLERKKWFNGRRFLVYMLLYSIFRFVLEFGRGDYPEEQLFHGLTPAQLTCLWLFPATIILWFILNALCKKKAK